MMNLETKRARIELFVKVAALLAVAFFVSPIIFATIKGLLGLLVTVVIGVIAINLAPWFAATVANWRLKAIKYEASQNPIETLQNDYQTRIEALRQFRESIRNFAAEIGLFKDKLEGFKKQYPAEAPKFDDQLNNMIALLNLRKDKYEQSKAWLDAYEIEIQKASAIWDMAQAAAAMNKASGVNAEDFLAKIQVETALDSVQKSLSTSFADLEVSLLDEAHAQKKALPSSEKPATAIPVAASDLDLHLDTVK